MSQDPSPAPKTPSPLWLVAVLPVGLLIGWAVAQLPGPRWVATTQPAAVVAEAPAQGARVHPGASAIEPSPPAESKLEPIAWTSFEDAVRESERSGKPILIDFNADWCGPCRSMKREVFDDGHLGPVVQSVVIPVSIVDRAREQGSNSPAVEQLMQQFQVEAFPTLVVFSPKTGRALRAQGYPGAEATVAWVGESARRVR